MFTNLLTVIYPVNNLEKAKSWCGLVTGKQPYFDQPFYVGYHTNGCELGLDPDLTGVPDGNRALAYWTVDDIQHADSHLGLAGASIKMSITDVDGGIQIATIQDPFGNVFGLIEEF